MGDKRSDSDKHLLLPLRRAECKIYPTITRPRTRLCTDFVAAVHFARASMEDPLSLVALNPIQIHCYHCRQQFSVKEEHLGKTVKCPSCQEEFTADLPNELPENKAIIEAALVQTKPTSRRSTPEEPRRADTVRAIGASFGTAVHAEENNGRQKGVIIGLCVGGVLLVLVMISVGVGVFLMVRTGRLRKITGRRSPLPTSRSRCSCRANRRSNNSPLPDGPSP